jgi:hypothetical protein
MPTVITAENIPAVLAQIVERQNEQDARINALIELCADQAVQLEQHEEQDRLQAKALRLTATQLCRSTGKATNGEGSGNAKADAKGNPGNVERLEERRGAGNGGARQKTATAAEPPKKAEPPKEAEPPPRKKAHRWT